MARLGRTDPVNMPGIMVTQEKSTPAGMAPPKPPITVQTNNIDVSMTNSSTIR